MVAGAFPLLSEPQKLCRRLKFYSALWYPFPEVVPELEHLANKNLLIRFDRGIKTNHGRMITVRSWKLWPIPEREKKRFGGAETEIEIIYI